MARISRASAAGSGRATAGASGSIHRSPSPRVCSRHQVQFSVTRRQPPASAPTAASSPNSSAPRFGAAASGRAKRSAWLAPSPGTTSSPAAAARRCWAASSQRRARAREAPSRSSSATSLAAGPGNSKTRARGRLRSSFFQKSGSSRPLDRSSSSPASAGGGLGAPSVSRSWRSSSKASASGAKIGAARRSANSTVAGREPSQHTRQPIPNVSGHVVARSTRSAEEQTAQTPLPRNADSCRSAIMQRFSASGMPVAGGGRAP